MKRMLVIILLLLLSSEVCDAQEGRWRRLISEDTYDMWVNPLNHNTIYVGGVSKQVFRSYDGGNNWDTLIVGTKFTTPALFNNLVGHPLDTNILLVGGLSFGDVRRSTDNGENWDVVLQVLTPIALNGKALIMKPDDPDVYYIGNYASGVIYKSIDKGATWDSVTTIMFNVQYKDQSGNTIDTLVHLPIASLGIREDSTNIIFANSTSGKIFISKDDGQNWEYVQTLVEPDSSQRDCEITRMVFSPRDPLTGYAVITYLFFTNTPNGGLYKTTDGGYNWDLVAFPDTSMWAVAVRELNGQDEVFIGGYSEDYYVPEQFKVQGVGIVRRSQDGGENWWPYDESINWVIEHRWSDISIQAIYFPENFTGYVVGQRGYLERTADGGNSWYNRAPGSWTDFRTVYFNNPDTGFVAGSLGRIRYTTNDGKIWQNQESGTNETINDIHFWDETTGLGVCENGIIIKTIDQGKNWTSVISGTNFDLHRISLLPDGSGYIAGDNGTLLKTNDFGDSWQLVDLSSTFSINSVYFTDNDNGFLAGENGLILKTDDGGENWRTINSNTTNEINAISFFSPDSGFVVGKGGLVLKTIDGGETWSVVSIFNLGIDFHDLFINSIGKIYIVGNLRTIVSSENFGEDWLIEMYGHSPRGNVWSTRYFGPPGEEKLYMATEAGFFVLDDPSSVGGYEMADENLRVSLTPEKDLHVSYKRKSEMIYSDLQFRLVSLVGETVLEKSINDFSEIVRFNLSIQSVPTGMYVCQMIEGAHSSIFKLIVE